MIRFTEEFDYRSYIPDGPDNPELSLFLMAKFSYDNVWATSRDPSSPTFKLKMEDWNPIGAVNNISTAWRLYFADKYNSAYNDETEEYLYYI